MNDPTYGAVITRAREWTQHKPLDYGLLGRERERAEAIRDRNTQRVIRELIDSDTRNWRHAS